MINAKFIVVFIFLFVVAGSTISHAEAQSDYGYNISAKSQSPSSAYPGQELELTLDLYNSGNASWKALRQQYARQGSFVLGTIRTDSTEDFGSRFYNAFWDRYYYDSNTSKSNKNRVADIQSCDNYSRINTGTTVTEILKGTVCKFRFKITIPYDAGTNTSETFCVLPLVEGPGGFWLNNHNLDSNLCWQFYIRGPQLNITSQINEFGYIQTTNDYITINGSSTGSSVLCNGISASGSSSWSCNINNLSPGYNEVIVKASDSYGSTERKVVVISTRALNPARKVVIVAHQDDDVLGFGGMILKEVRENNRAVKIIHLVSPNDGNGGWMGCCYTDPLNLYCFKDQTMGCNDNGYSQERINEENRALLYLGLGADDDIVLGQTVNLQDTDYSTMNQLTASLVNELSLLSNNNLILEIYTHHPEDGNSAHRAVYNIVISALSQLGWNNTPIYSALIHYKSDANDFIFPNPRCDSLGDSNCNHDTMSLGYVNLLIRENRLTMNESLNWPGDIIRNANVDTPVDESYRKAKLSAISQYELSTGKLNQLDWNGFLIAFVKNNEPFYKHCLNGDCQNEYKYSLISSSPEGLIDVLAGEHKALTLSIQNKSNFIWEVKTNSDGGRTNGTLAFGTVDDDGIEKYYSEFYYTDWDNYYSQSDPDKSKHNRVSDVGHCDENKSEYNNGDTCTLSFVVVAPDMPGSTLTFCVRPLFEGGQWLDRENGGDNIICWSFNIRQPTTSSLQVDSDSIQCVDESNYPTVSSASDNDVNLDYHFPSNSVKCILTKKELSTVNVPVQETTVPVSFDIVSGWNVIGNKYSKPLDFDDAHVSYRPAGITSSLKLSESADYISGYCWLYENGTKIIVQSAAASKPDNLPDNTEIQTSIPPLSGCAIYSESNGILTLTP